MTNTYSLGLLTRLAQENPACLVCNVRPGFTLKNKCEICATKQEILDTAFSVLMNRHFASINRKGFVEVGLNNLDQLEAALVILGNELGLEQTIFLHPNAGRVVTHANKTV